MLALLTQKRDRDRHGQPVDALEAALAPCLNAALPGLVPVPMPNHLATAQDLVRTLDPGLVILTGGNDLDPEWTGVPWPAADRVPERDAVEGFLVRWALEQGRPLLGLCRGMQFLNLLLGGRHSCGLPGHPAGRSHLCEHADGPQEVNSFHDCGVLRSGLAPGLTPLASCGEVVEAAAGSRGGSAILGVQWHPERPGGNLPFFTRLIRAHLFPEGLPCAR